MASSSRTSWRRRTLRSRRATSTRMAPPSPQAMPSSPTCASGSARSRRSRTRRCARWRSVTPARTPPPAPRWSGRSPCTAWGITIPGPRRPFPSCKRGSTGSPGRPGSWPRRPGTSRPSPSRRAPSPPRPSSGGRRTSSTGCRYIPPGPGRLPGPGRPHRAAARGGLGAAARPGARTRWHPPRLSSGHGRMPPSPSPSRPWPGRW